MEKLDPYLKNNIQIMRTVLPIAERTIQSALDRENKERENKENSEKNKTMFSEKTIQKFTRPKAQSRESVGAINERTTKNNNTIDTSKKEASKELYDDEWER